MSQDRTGSNAKRAALRKALVTAKIAANVAKVEAAR
jgi:hypothetical protein